MNIEFLVLDENYGNINDHELIRAELTEDLKLISKIGWKGYYKSSLKEISNDLLAIGKSKEELLNEIYKQTKPFTSEDDIKIIVCKFFSNKNHSSLIFKILE